MRYVATNLRFVVERQGIKASAIAREINRSPSLVSLVIQGKRTVSQEDATRIANIFRLPVALLFAPTPEKTRKKARVPR